MWDISQSTANAYIKLFLGPTLAILTLTLDCLSVSLPAVAELLAPITDSLHDLDLDSINFHHSASQWTDDEFVHPFSDLLCGLRNIKSVCTNVYLEREAVCYLAASSCVDLGIGNDATNLLHLITGMATIPFPELRSLFVVSHVMADAIRLVGRLDARKLQALTIHETEPQPEMQYGIEHLIRTLDEKCSRMTLTSLRVLGSYERTATSPVTFSALRPLLAFGNMMTMEISANNFPVDLDDGDITEIAMAWPRLQIICFSAWPLGRPALSRITLTGLVALVHHCPDLQSIDIVIHVDAVDFTLLTPAVAIKPNSRITALVMRHSAIDDAVKPADLARFLSDLFPKLARIHDYDSRSRVIAGILHKASALLLPNRKKA
jgi:hypothetical protein